MPQDKASASLINELINQFGRLPGIGKKSAQRLAYYLLSQPVERSRQLAETILETRKRVHFCPECCNLTADAVCEICASDRRDRQVVCVVESPADVFAMERSREYKGLYHVLHGAISPMQDIGPEDLHLRELLTRLRDHPEIEEVILANNPTVEGEATATYIARLLKPAGIKLSRIAQGIPMGSSIEYADEVTLGRAIDGRTPL